MKLNKPSGINKTIKALLIFFSISFYGFSQQTATNTALSNNNELVKDKRGFVMISMGPSIPLGDLAIQDGNNPDAGLATLGFDFKLYGGYRFNKNIGVCAFLGSQFFTMNAQAMADACAKADPRFSYTVNIPSGWGMSYRTVGAYGNIPLDKANKVSLEPRLTIGFGSASSPHFSLTVSSSSNGTITSNTAEQLSKKSNLVGVYGIGSALRVNIGKNVCLSGNIDYLGTMSKPWFSGVEIRDKYNNQTTTSFGMNMSSLTISIGFGLRFGS